MAYIIDPIGDNEEKLLAPFKCMTIGCLNLPLVHKGDAPFHLATAESRQDLEEISNIILTHTAMD